ncbi:MAG: DUF4279 domain-containing protein [Elusimicrobia bacterium]|nr:DUF4279 domain-containing protein [Elusimicrobiota bacterium]
MARENTTVAFKIQSASLTAVDLASRLGLKPDRTWVKGAARGAFGAIEKMHGLELESKLGPQASLNEHVQEMLKRLAACAVKIGEFGAQVSVEFTCTVARRRGPHVLFGRDELRWLAAMGAALDLDIQIVSDSPAPGAPGAAAGTAADKPK